MTTRVENTPAAWSDRAAKPASWEAALWSQAGQTERFEAVRDLLDVRAGESVLDFGCGTGRFCDFLPRWVTYYGFDWAEGMRERCRRDHPQALVLEAVAGEFDHVVAIGPFNLSDNWSKRQTWETLGDLYARARRSLVVSLYSGDDPQHLAYDPGELVEFARSLTSRFLVDVTYRDNDLVAVLR